MLAPRIVFVLPVNGSGGGANSVVQECIGLRRLGVTASIALKDDNLSKFSNAYPELYPNRVSLETYGSAGSLATVLTRNDVAVATTNASVFDLKQALEAIGSGAPRPRPAYYVQDYEPLFYDPGSALWRGAYDSYTAIAGCALFAKTKWLCDMVYNNHGAQVTKVEPSVDHSAFYPDLSRPAPRLTVTAMLRPQTPRRAPLRTVRILEAINARYGGAVTLQVFGSTDPALESYGLRLPPSIYNHGQMRRTDVPGILRSSDLFLDLSDFQAFGRTGLEAMACACVPLLPVLGGVSEFAVDGLNAFVVDTRADQMIMEAVDTFMSLSPRALEEMKMRAVETAARYSIHKAALSELRLFRQLID